MHNVNKVVGPGTTQDKERKPLPPTLHPDRKPPAKSDSTPESDQLERQDSIEDSVEEFDVNDEEDNKSNIEESKSIDNEDSSFSYASITREVEKATQVFQAATTDTWKQELEYKLQHQLKASVTTAKEKILEMLGELLTHLDTLCADMTEHEIKLEHRTQKAEEVSQQLMKQQAEMEQMSYDIQKQHAALQELLSNIQTKTILERMENQATREEARKRIKWDIEQASHHHLVQHEKKSEVIMTAARTKQMADFRQTCREIQQEYKKRIEQKYEDLEAESNQFADQAILDLGDLLHQEKNNILNEVTQEIPDQFMQNLAQEITAKLTTTTQNLAQEITTKLNTTTHDIATKLKTTATTKLEKATATHLSALTEATMDQRMTLQAQLQQTAQNHTEQMEIKYRTLQATHTTMETTMKETNIREIIDAIDNIKAEASITFSLQLQTQIQQALDNVQSKTAPHISSTQERSNPPNANYWADPLKQTTLPTRTSSETPT
jgi:hypothetical protein